MVEGTATRIRTGYEAAVLNCSKFEEGEEAAGTVGVVGEAARRKVEAGEVG